MNPTDTATTVNLPSANTYQDKDGMGGQIARVLVFLLFFVSPFDLTLQGNTVTSVNLPPFQSRVIVATNVARE